jgi:DNA-binding MarR family transcriptional regulator
MRAFIGNVEVRAGHPALARTNPQPRSLLTPQSLPLNNRGKCIMKMHQVSYFLALCEEKSFTRAAKRCGVKQPSITRAIKELENEIGGALFERSHSYIRLTNLGRLVRPDFTQIERSATEVRLKIVRFMTARSTVKVNAEPWRQTCAS